MELKNKGGKKMETAENEKTTDVIKELFGETIYTYTDEQAVDDGYLVKQNINGKDITGHRITRSAYEELKAHYASQYLEYDDAQFISFFSNEAFVLASYAVKKWADGGILKTDFNFRVGEYDHSKILWYVPNELGGVTVMKPEDY